jgi:D-beta-D-heptose 7-phosphate kinase/D-beta-D-heptose 1-phosphate adenosyltransferase
MESINIVYIDRIGNLLERFRGIRVLVIGDFMLDECLWGHIVRISPEAPVPILNVARRQKRLGGAGNVVKNLRSLGVQVSAIGVVGNDSTGKSISSQLNRIGVDAEMVSEAPRTSTRKTRLMSLEHGQQVFRFDRETAHPIKAATEQCIIKFLYAFAGTAHAIICSDYLKGALTLAVLRAAIEVGWTHHVPVVMSPKGSDAIRYRGADVLIQNQKELELMSGFAIKGEDSLVAASQRVLALLQAQSLLVTRSAKGMSLFQKSGDTFRETHIATMARSVYDVTGAGDTVASVFTAGIACGANHETAAILANLAAGIVVGKRGTACVTTAEILHSSHENLVTQADSARQAVS